MRGISSQPPEEARCPDMIPGDRCRGSVPARRATTMKDALGLAKKHVLRDKSSPPPGTHLQWDHWRCVCSNDIQMHQKTMIFQNRNPHLDKELFSNSVSISPIDLKLNPAKSLLLRRSPSTNPMSVLKHCSTSPVTTERQGCLPNTALCHLLHLAFIETHEVNNLGPH